jgi:hypothetical protein
MAMNISTKATGRSTGNKLEIKNARRPSLGDNPSAVRRDVAYGGGRAARLICVAY